MKSSLLLCISFIVFLMAPLLHAAEAAEPSGQGMARQEILILNSYHPGYAWSDDEQASIIDVFRGKDKNWLPVIEYLDLRRLSDGRHLTELKRLFRLKYQNKKFSVVIAMDNPALEFAVDNQAGLFGNAPIVFCGINNLTPSLLKGRSEVTGIVEAIDIAGTIEVMLRLHSAAQEIFSPQDYTTTGLAIRKELEALVPRFGAKVRFRFKDPLTMEELLKELERLPKNSLVLAVGFITDKSGRTFDTSETTKLFYEHSPVPIYSTFEQQLGSGIVGGKLLSARYHGAAAARIALRVLAGEKASAIPVVLVSDSQLMFDYKVMSRFGIPLSALPEGSTVINKPVSFYAAHRVIIHTALGIIGGLVVVISLLAINIIQRRRSSEVIRRSEELFKIITSSTPDHLLVQDSDLRYSFVMNPQMGLTQQDMIGKTDHDFLSKEDADKLTEIKRQVLKTGRPAHVEVPLTSSTGEQQFFDGSYIPKFDAKGQIDGMIGYFRNITERKRAAEALRAANAYNRSLIEASIDPLVTISPDGKITDVNAATERVTGCTRDDLIGTDFSNYFSDPEMARTGYRRVFTEGHVRDYPLDIRHCDGHVTPVFYNATLYHNEKGEVSGIFAAARDITERKRAEEALCHQNEMLQTILDSIPVMVSLHDREGHHQLVNRCWQSTLGWSLEKAQYKDILAELYPDQAYRKYVVDYIAVAAGTWSDFKTRTRDGRVLDTSWVNVPLSDGSNIGIGIDITERKKTEETLRKSEIRYRELFENMGSGVSVYETHNNGEDFIFKEYNAAAEILDKTPRGQAIGRSVVDVFPGVKDFGLFDVFQRVYRTGKAERYPVTFYKDEKISGWRENYVYKLPSGEIVEVFEDITQRKQAEGEVRELLMMLETVPSSVIVHDADGNFLYANQKTFDIHGYSRDEFMALNLRRITVPASEKLIDARIQELFDRGAISFEVNHLKKDGTILPLLINVKNTKWGGKSVFLSVATDITERKRAEEELLASREQMRALAGRLQTVREEERTQIAREIHDELGGALTGLKVDFSFLTKSALKIENESIRTSLLAGTDSINKSIDTTIQAVRRIAMQLRPGILDDLGLVAALEWQLKDFEKRTGIRCEFFPPVEDISLDTDLSTALFRIFQEALTNVARHAGATEVRVRLSADADSSTLEVEDNGKGIEKGKILSSKSLGLLGMRERVQMFGGRITVTGTPGIGTKVTVEISPVEKRKMDRDQEGAAG